MLPSTLVCISLFVFSVAYQYSVRIVSYFFIGEDLECPLKYLVYRLVSTLIGFGCLFLLLFDDLQILTLMIYLPVVSLSFALNSQLVTPPSLWVLGV